MLPVEEAGAEKGHRSHFTENRLWEVEFPDRGHKRIQGEVRTPTRNSRLFLFTPKKPPANIAHRPTFYTLEVTSNTIC